MSDPVVFAVIFFGCNAGSFALGAWVYHRGRGGHSPLPPLPRLPRRPPDDPPPKSAETVDKQRHPVRP